MRKKNATNSSAPLWSRVCSEWFGFHCEWQNHTMYSIDDTFWIIWIIWIFPNISYFLHLFHTASEIYPPSMSSQVTYNWKESSVRPCACNFVPRTASAAGRDEWKKRERERENPTIRAWGHTWAFQNVMWSMNPMPINNRSNANKLKTQLDQKPWWVEQKTCHSRIPARHCFLVSNRHKAYSMALLPSFGFSFGSCFLSSL